MSDPVIKRITPVVKLGEGPHWCENDQAIIYVDLKQGDIHRHFVNSGRNQVLHIDDGGSGSAVTVVIPIIDHENYYVICVGRSLAIIHWLTSDPDNHTIKPTVFHTVELDILTNRFNDGKCDPAGRLWAGTMGSEKSPGEIERELGTVYRIGSDLKDVSRQVEKVSISNGLAWSMDNKTFYYIDSCAYSIDAFDYDHNTGDISNRRVIIDYKAEGLIPDIPDGMTIDADGKLWVANYFGNKIICVDPKERKIVRQITMPVLSLTSVCWGGSDYSTLFVTSAQPGATPEQLAKQTDLGATFSITGLGTKGLPPQNFKIDQSVFEALIAKN